MTICVDLDAHLPPAPDGTPAPPDAETVTALRSLMAMDAVYVLTARPAARVATRLRESGLRAVADDDHDLPGWTRHGVLLVTAYPYPAHASIGPHAIPLHHGWPHAIRLAARQLPVDHDPESGATLV